ncbi:diguanylate cyclase [Cyanobacterium aponinum UTEX 3222]|uniref:Response regulator receiver modulated diguanylate cyclase n=1 Tax=Cyanobacterium aponinum (strain PCC 10605) TaxID=755178 RepID=K9Z7N7_CYAAP|nr:diguanylate cyclase [Cyanobacterium aponinum]AFZ54600.1 response regulator receiver modulated diguanylate cyclase [Cyanobacterium aponinum PCC 10605]MBD2394640.1 diguanylate cyclase [Cyanobacterium aponinum FACHB-4101]PHV63859.1 diguanylate cyclase response regulator [Cyanobacterium aponinum IPPAS B-1201]WRL43453.1 diguanylate cyclase [Cyanobacterium aponinum UTEX 3222]
MTDYNPKNFLILAVDDNSVNRILIEKILRKEGYQAKILAHSQEVLPYMEQINPDLILLDLMMPNINGLELCQQIKLNPHFQDIPVIFITASDEKQDLLKAFDLGAVDYITKPFHNRELLARIKTHLELKFTRDELKKALVELEKLATTDELTGISNRRNFSTLAEREFNLAKRQKRYFALLILDIDYFKKINDSHGHIAGDFVIKSVAQQCVLSIRQEDLCARWGGEEFIIFLSESMLEDGIAVARRLRQDIEELSVAFESEQINVTVSIGVAVYNPEDKNVNQTIIRGDMALYQAKNSGRNRVVDENGVCYF